MKVTHAIKIHVIDHRFMIVLVNQGECGARNLVFLGGSEPAHDSLRKRGLARPEVAREKNQGRRLQRSPDFAPRPNRLVRGMRDDFLASHGPAHKKSAGKHRELPESNPKRSAAPAPHPRRQDPRRGRAGKLQTPASTTKPPRRTAPSAPRASP